MMVNEEVCVGLRRSGMSRRLGSVVFEIQAASLSCCPNVAIIEGFVFQSTRQEVIQVYSTRIQASRTPSELFPFTSPRLIDSGKISEDLRRSTCCIVCATLAKQLKRS